MKTKTATDNNRSTNNSHDSQQNMKGKTMEDGETYAIIIKEYVV
jgi:hypothetical protein